jgi:hypothetical protein
VGRLHRRSKEREHRWRGSVTLVGPHRFPEQFLDVRQRTCGPTSIDFRHRGLGLSSGLASAVQAFDLRHVHKRALEQRAWMKRDPCRGRPAVLAVKVIRSDALDLLIPVARSPLRKQMHGHHTPEASKGFKPMLDPLSKGKCVHPSAFSRSRGGDRRVATGANSCAQMLRSVGAATASMFNSRELLRDVRGTLRSLLPFVNLRGGTTRSFVRSEGVVRATLIWAAMHHPPGALRPAQFSEISAHDSSVARI